MNFIEELYYGNINPNEKRCKKATPYDKALSIFIANEDKLKEALKETTINKITVPYLTNVTADYVTDKAQVKDLLARQVASSVRWQQSVEKMIADGVTTFIEIGPGKTLSGFMKKIDKEMRVFNVEDIASLEKTLEGLSQ